MYLHIGNHKNLRIKHIIGVFDLDSASVSPITKQYLREKEKTGMSEYITQELPKSFILTDDGMLHYSQISTGALTGRMTQATDRV